MDNTTFYFVVGGSVVVVSGIVKRLSNNRNGVRNSWARFARYREQYDGQPEKLAQLRNYVDNYGIVQGVQVFEKVMFNDAERRRIENLQIIDRSMFEMLSNKAQYNYIEDVLKNNPIPGLRYTNHPVFENGWDPPKTEAQQRTLSNEAAEKGRLLKDLEDKYGK